MWSIGLIKNTLKVPKAAVPELFKFSEDGCKDIWWKEKDVVDKEGLLRFNSDHMEHMDFLTYQEAQKILKAHKAVGTVRFGSLDGDNAGTFWGYRFDGKGNMFETKGEIVWKRVIQKKSRFSTPARSGGSKPEQDPWS